MSKNSILQDFTKDVEALVKKYEGTAYSIVVDTPDLILVRSDITTHNSLVVLYMNTTILLRKMEEYYEGKGAPYNKNFKKEY